MNIHRTIATLHSYLYTIFAEPLKAEGKLSGNDLNDAVHLLTSNCMSHSGATLQFAEYIPGFQDVSGNIIGFFQAKDSCQSKMGIWKEASQPFHLVDAMANISAPPIVLESSCLTVTKTDQHTGLEKMTLKCGPIFLHPKSKIPARLVQEGEQIFLACWERANRLQKVNSWAVSKKKPFNARNLLDLLIIQKTT